MSYLCHYCRIYAIMDAIYNFSFHYTTESTLLTFEGPIHKGQGMGQSATSCKGWLGRLGCPALSDKA